MPTMTVTKCSSIVVNATMAYIVSAAYVDLEYFLEYEDE